MYYLMRNMRWDDFDYMNTSPLFITESDEIEGCVCLNLIKFDFHSN